MPIDRDLARATEGAPRRPAPIHGERALHRLPALLLTLLAVFEACSLGHAQAAPPEVSSSAVGEASAPSTPSTEARQQASTHFSRGVELFEEGAFRASLVEFQRAYELAPDYRLLYNIGHAEMELHDYLRATQSYERYLSDGGSAIPAERQREVEKMLRSLVGRVGRLAIHVNVMAAEVFVDEQRAGLSPLASTVAVNVGRHRVYGRTVHGAIGEQIVDVAGGDLAEVNLELSVPGAPPGLLAVADAPAAKPTDKSLSRKQRAALASWALAVPAVATAVVAGVLAHGKADDLDAVLDMKPATPASKESADELRDAAHAWAIASDVMTGVSAALVVTGVVLWMRGQNQEKEVPSRGAISWGLGVGTGYMVGHF